MECLTICYYQGETGTLQLFKYVWGEVGRCKLYLIGTVSLVVRGWGEGVRRQLQWGFEYALPQFQQ